MITTTTTRWWWWKVMHAFNSSSSPSSKSVERRDEINSEKQSRAKMEPRKCCRSFELNWIIQRESDCCHRWWGGGGFLQVFAFLFLIIKSERILVRRSSYHAWQMKLFLLLFTFFEQENCINSRWRKYWEEFVWNCDKRIFN